MRDTVTVSRVGSACYQDIISLRKIQYTIVRQRTCEHKVETVSSLCHEKSEGYQVLASLGKTSDQPWPDEMDFSVESVLQFQTHKQLMPCSI